MELPEALAEALRREPELGEFFASLAFTHRREYATWIAEAKKDETRVRRVAKAVEMLRAKVKHP